MDHIYEVINDMDLALEGVPVSEDNINVKRGLAILQYIMPAFKYSSNDLSINDKVSEIKEYCILNNLSYNYGMQWKRFTFFMTSFYCKYNSNKGRE